MNTNTLPATILAAKEKFELACKDASALQIVSNFGAAFTAVNVIALLREAMTDEVMDKVFMPLMNTKIGFLTDRNGRARSGGRAPLPLYTRDIVRDCIIAGNGETQQAESSQEEPQSDFLKTTTEVMQKHLVPLCNGSSSRGLIVVGCDTDTKDKNGEDSTGVMVGFCGNYGAIIKGLKELLTGKQSAPIVERATREIAFEKMIKGGGIESFLKDIMNNN